jgi:hypothetical protein
MTEISIAERLDILTRAVLTMATNVGARLNRADMCGRLGVCGKTLSERVSSKKIPAPGKDGKWLLSEVVEWEIRKLG